MRGVDTLALAERLPQLVVLEREHPAVGVADDERLPRAEQVVGDHERAHGVVRRDPAGVADHVCVAVLETQGLGRIDPGVHAGDDREAAAGRHRQIPFLEPGDVRLVRGADLLEHGHCGLIASDGEVSKPYQMKRR